MISRDLSIFGNLWAEKGCFFGSKTVFLGQEMHYNMVCIAYYTEFYVSICNYAQKLRICRKKVNTRSTKVLWPFLPSPKGCQLLPPWVHQIYPLIRFPSPCTSRNLNLNSFCDLTDNTSMAKWKPAIQATYGNISELPDYVRELSGPMRLVYPDGMAERELISSLAKVQINQVVVLSEKSQAAIVYRESTTMPLKRILQLWISSLGSQLCLVRSNPLIDVLQTWPWDRLR